MDRLPRLLATKARGSLRKAAWFDGGDVSALWWVWLDLRAASRGIVAASRLCGGPGEPCRSAIGGRRHGCRLDFDPS